VNNTFIFFRGVGSTTNQSKGFKWYGDSQVLGWLQWLCPHMAADWHGHVRILLGHEPPFRVRNASVDVHPSCLTVWPYTRLTCLMSEDVWHLKYHSAFICICNHMHMCTCWCSWRCTRINHPII
jgi:hypothetical protein